MCKSCFLLTIQIKSIQIKSNNDDHIPALQDYIMVQELMSPDIIASKCSKNDTSSSGKRNIWHKMLLTKRIRMIVHDMLMDISFLIMSYMVNQKFNEIIHT